MGLQETERPATIPLSTILRATFICGKRANAQPYLVYVSFHLGIEETFLEKTDQSTGSHFDILEFILQYMAFVAKCKGSMGES